MFGTTTYSVNYENMRDSDAETLDRFRGAVRTAGEALAGVDGQLHPKIKRVLVHIAPGGAGSEHGRFLGVDPHGTAHIRMYKATALTQDQASLNLTALHELQHLVTYANRGFRRSASREEAVEDERISWGAELKYMRTGDTRFTPNAEMRRTIETCSADPALCTRY